MRTSREMNPATSSPVIDLLEAQKNISHMGGTMRLGAYPCKVEEGTKAFEVYQKKEISERHRHRYEFNNEYTKQFEEAGMVLSGVNPDAGLVEIVELPNHPWFIGVQFSS
jgi:CTP synthase